MGKVTAAVLILSLAVAARAAEPGPYERRAREVTDHIQKTFHDPRSGVYLASDAGRKLDFVWGQGVMLANLTAAARVDPATYGPALRKYFEALDAYWDAKVAIPGYEPSPTAGGGDDKYYDDNEWIVISLLEAYETNRDPRYLGRADEALRFVLSGWDDAIGGGIWWHEDHKDGTKNTCSNGPAAVGCLRAARFREGKQAEELVAEARKIVDWTRAALQRDDGLFSDRKVVATGRVRGGALTYNSALMMRALLGLHRATGRQDDLDEALRIARAADWFLDRDTGVYRDPVKFAHLMVEADLEVYRVTNDDLFLRRAMRNVDAYYDRWKARPPGDLISNASIARVLWLASESESEAGKAFWSRAERARP